MNNTFPFQSSSIITPVGTAPVVKKDDVYKQTIFERDNRLVSAIDRQVTVDKNTYIPVVNTIMKFNNPVNSNDLIESKNYKSFTKEELKDKYIHDIYDMMTYKVSDVVKKDELDRIQGTRPIDTVIGSLYKPVYSSIDLSTNNYTFNDVIIDAKYQPYEGIPVHKFG